MNPRLLLSAVLEKEREREVTVKAGNYRMRRRREPCIANFIPETVRICYPVHIAIIGPTSFFPHFDLLATVSPPPFPPFFATGWMLLRRQISSSSCEPRPRVPIEMPGITSLYSCNTERNMRLGSQIIV